MNIQMLNGSLFCTKDNTRCFKFILINNILYISYECVCLKITENLTTVEDMGYFLRSPEADRQAMQSLHSSSPQKPGLFLSFCSSIQSTLDMSSLSSPHDYRWLLHLQPLPLSSRQEEELKKKKHEEV